MGLFSTPRHSRKEQYISSDTIKKFVSSSNISSLDRNEEELVEAELLSAKRSNGKISLQAIYESLHKLKNKNKISENDEKKLMNIFVDYFDKSRK